MMHELESSELFDKELEDILVSQSLKSSKIASLFSITYGLTPYHFYQPHCRDLFDLAINFNGEERTIGALGLELTRVTGRILSDSKDLISRFVDSPNAEETFLQKESAERVKLLYRWRNVKSSAEKILAASESLDTDKMNVALNELDESTAVSSTTSLDASGWGVMLFDWLAEEGSEEAFPTPFFELNDSLSGGLRRGEFVVVGGYTSHGKSVLVDQMLDFIASEKPEVRCHLYMTEMTFLERGQRLLARETGIPLRDIRQKAFSKQQYSQIVDVLKNLKYGASLASQSTIDDVCRDIIRCEWDVCIVDLMHGFDHDNPYEMDKITRRLAAASKGNGKNKGTTIIATSHFNDVNAQGKTYNPNQRPGLRSLKGSTSIKQNADHIIFIHREREDDRLTNFGKIWTEKARNGSLTNDIEVRLDTASMRFVRR